MVRNILNLEGAQPLSNAEQKLIKGSGSSGHGHCFPTGCIPNSRGCEPIVVPCDSVCPEGYGGGQPFCFA